MPGHVVHLQPDAVRILEEDGVVSRRPGSVLGRVDDRGAEIAHQRVHGIDVGALARPEAQVVQPDATLDEPLGRDTESAGAMPIAVRPPTQ